MLLTLQSVGINAALGRNCHRDHPCEDVPVEAIPKKEIDIIYDFQGPSWISPDVIWQLLRGNATLSIFCFALVTESLPNRNTM